MRLIPTLSFTLTLLFATNSFAAEIALFKVFKPVNPQNVLQLGVDVSNCRLGQLQFLWIMNHGRPDQYTKRSMVEGKIREKFPVSRTHPSNKAGCQGAQPGTCSSFAVAAEEFEWVAHGLADASLVVKAEKQASGCVVGAYLDAGAKGVVKIKSLNANGDVLQSPSLFNHSATIRVKALTVEAADGSKEVYRCPGNCVRKITF